MLQVMLQVTVIFLELSKKLSQSVQLHEIVERFTGKLSCQRKGSVVSAR